MPTAETLALKYRPVKFSDVVGQKHVKDVMRAMVAAGTVPPVLIFGGSRGTGKTSMARTVAAALNCTNSPAPGELCGVCVSCISVRSNTHQSVLEVDAASNGGVAEMEKIRHLVSIGHAGNYRVVILDEVHSASKPAFHSMLKMLEEPPEATVFILVTTEVDKILDTVRSRAMLFNFRRLASEEITSRLAYIAEQESIPADPGMLREITLRVNGSLRDAIMLLDQMHRIETYTVEGFRERFGLSNVAASFVKAAIDGNHARGFEVVDQYFEQVGEATALVSDLVNLVTDMLSVQAGGLPRRASSEQDAKIRAALANKTTTDRLVGVSRVLWDLRGRLRTADAEQRSQVELAFVLISEALCPVKVVAPPVETKPIPEVKSARVSLAEVAKLSS